MERDSSILSGNSNREVSSDIQSAKISLPCNLAAVTVRWARR
jgi:hypothetical protein